MTGTKARREAPGRRSNGFSIIELMIVITIIGVLAAVAIPAFDDLIRNNRRSVVINELVSDVMAARGESAKRGLPVSICATSSSSPTECTTSATGTWDFGWMIFFDADGQGDFDAGTDTLLKQYVNDYADIRVRTAAAIIIRPFNQGTAAATITVCDKRGASKARAVVVEQNGRPRSSEKDRENNALTCPS